MFQMFSLFFRMMPFYGQRVGWLTRGTNISIFSPPPPPLWDFRVSPYMWLLTTSSFMLYSILRIKLMVSLFLCTRLEINASRDDERKEKKRKKKVTGCLLASRARLYILEKRGPEGMSIYGNRTSGGPAALRKHLFNCCQPPLRFLLDSHTRWQGVSFFFFSCSWRENPRCK